jgi:hypothetical protein
VRLPACTEKGKAVPKTDKPTVSKKHQKVDIESSCDAKGIDDGKIMGADGCPEPEDREALYRQREQWAATLCSQGRVIPRKYGNADKKATGKAKYA